MRKSRCRISGVLVMVLLMTGIYTIYGNAESFAERVASLEMFRLYEEAKSGVQKGQEAVAARFERTEQNTVENTVWVSERVSTISRMVIGRLSERSGRMNRERRMLNVVWLILLVTCFRFRCHSYIAAWLHAQEKWQREVFINYIHDIDGKKRTACLA